MYPRMVLQVGSSGCGWSQPPEEGGLGIFLETSSHEKNISELVLSSTAKSQAQEGTLNLKKSNLK